MVRRIALIALVIATALPLAAETWKGVSLMDANCSAKKDVMASPEKHTRHCAMMCSKSGFGAVVDGKFVKFDQKGSDLAAAAITKATSKDNLRADVTGEMKDGVIAVSKLEMNK